MPEIEENEKMHDIPYSAEVKRKLIHLFSLNIPIWYIFLDKQITLIIMFAIAIITVLLDLTSKRLPVISYIWDKVFGEILRKHEKKQKEIYLNGASWLVISAFLTILIFPKIIAVIALTILIVSDISSALIGKKFGKSPIFVNKTVEGSTAFFVSAYLVILTYYFIYAPGTMFLLAGLFAALASTLFEAISTQVKMDDNLLAPVSFSLVMWAGELLANLAGQSFIHIL
jgi:dolichol kinase